MMYLKPSEIYYSQDSISNTFYINSQHSCKMIGETLDDICEDRCSIFEIPTIRVCRHNGKYVTADNRRLWVFRHLERLGKLNQVPVNLKSVLRPAKLTSVNGGSSVRVRGDAGGIWYRKSSLSYTRTNRNDNFIDGFRPSSSSSSYERPSNHGYGYESSSSNYNSSRPHSSYSSYRSYSPPTSPPQNDSWCNIL